MDLEKVHLSIRIQSEDLVPEEITAAMGVAPSMAYRKGDPIVQVAKSGRPIVLGHNQHGMWQLRSSIPSDAPLQQHLAWAEQWCAEHDVALARVQSGGCRIDVFVGLFVLDDQLGISLPLHEYPTIARLGIAVEFDCYTSMGPE